MGQRLEIENAIIGTMICRSDAFTHDLDIEDFSEPMNKALFANMARLKADKREWDFRLLMGDLNREILLHANEITFAGDPLCFTPSILPAYVRELKEHRAKEIVNECIVEMGVSNPIALAKEIERRTTKLLTTEGQTPLREILKILFGKLEQTNDGRVSGITSGFNAMDGYTWGFQPKSLALIAGRPSMGKSCLLANIAVNAASSGKRVFFQALEESSESIATRMLSMKSKISNTKIRRREIQGNDWDSISMAMNHLSGIDVILDETVGLQSGEICQRIRKAHAVNPLDLVIVDHIQRIREKGEASRHLEVSRSIQNFKNLAKDLSISVIVASQISRAAEMDREKRPELRHLKESGDLEQEADVIMLMYRPGYYDRNTLDKSLVEIVVAKNRDGKTGPFDLRWNPAIMEFYEGPAQNPGHWSDQ